MSKPMTCNLVEALMRDSCDFKWRTAIVSSEFGSSRMAKVSSSGTVGTPELFAVKCGDGPHPPIVEEIAACRIPRL